MATGVAYGGETVNKTTAHLWSLEAGGTIQTSQIHDSGLKQISHATRIPVIFRFHSGSGKLKFCLYFNLFCYI